jgi:predicted DCC family thiol-disulfide oxidoreductase YuxK
MAQPILLYDGVCGLCNRVNQFVLRRDPAGFFRFASLQSPLAARILSRHGADARDLDTVYVVIHADLPGELLLPRSDAVVFFLKNLQAPSGSIPPDAVFPLPSRGRGIWLLVGSALHFVPRRLRDWGYRLVARHRYRIFGRSETCMLPSPADRDCFLDL